MKKAIAVRRKKKKKGFDILINCWKEIEKKYPDWQLDIYGEGTCREELQHQIDTLQLHEKIKLCGLSNNIIEAYPQYSLHLMTSRFEGQGIVLIEAQACGLPSVVFNYEYGANDIIENEYNGILVEQGKCKYYIEAIMKMMSSKELRKEYGTNAISISKQYYRENIINKWIQIINN